jgi:hypothetical protein
VTYCYTIVAALVALGLLGRGLAGALYGSTFRWSLSLILGGAALTFVGTQLKILWRRLVPSYRSPSCMSGELLNHATTKRCAFSNWSRASFSTTGK